MFHTGTLILAACSNSDEAGSNGRTGFTNSSGRFIAGPDQLAVGVKQARVRLGTTQPLPSLAGADQPGLCTFEAPRRSQTAADRNILGSAETTEESARLSAVFRTRMRIAPSLFGVLILTVVSTPTVFAQKFSTVEVCRTDPVLRGFACHRVRSRSSTK